jgi:hypothetical protein
MVLNTPFHIQSSDDILRGWITDHGDRVLVPDARRHGQSEPGTSYTFAAGSIGDMAGFYATCFGIFPSSVVAHNFFTYSRL